MYDCAGFLEKNRDTLRREISEVLKNSDNFIVRSLFFAPLSRTGNLMALVEKGSKARGAGVPLSATPLFSRRAPVVRQMVHVGIFIRNVGDGMDAT